MKKFLGIAFSLLLAISCTEEGLTPDSTTQSIITPPPGGGGTPVPINTNPDMTAFTGLMQTEVNYTMNYPDVYLYKIQNDVILNSQRFTRDRSVPISQGLNMATFNGTSFANTFPYSSVSTVFKKPSEISNASTVYNAAQLSVLDAFTQAMYNADDLMSIIGACSYVNSKIRMGNFTKIQKFQLQMWVVNGQILAEDFFQGETEGVRTVIIESGVQPTALNCKISWRNVWASSVLGGVGGAVRGAWVGGTAGTFTLPGVGTVTGAVGGGVIGGAAGFVSGTGYGIAQELLLSCFSQNRYLGTMPAYLCADMNAIMKNLNCIQENADIKYIWRLNI